MLSMVMVKISPGDSQLAASNMRRELKSPAHMLKQQILPTAG